jgi:hypothetical protein
MAARAAERVRQEFALEAIIARQAALYRELVDHSTESQLNEDTSKRELWGY